MQELDIPGPQHPAAQEKLAGFRQGSDADAIQVFRLGKVPGGKSVKAAAFHLRRCGGQGQSCQTAQGGKQGKNTVSEHRSEPPKK